MKGLAGWNEAFRLAPKGRERGAIMDSSARKEKDEYGILRGLLRLWYTEQIRRTEHQKDELADYCGNC